MIKIGIVDGQGGGLGRSMILSVRQRLGSTVEIYALATNEYAAGRMSEVGADEACFREEQVQSQCANMDIIMGTAGILNAGSMKGELTCRIAAAVACSKAKKIIIPMNKCGLFIAGTGVKTASDMIDEAADMLCNIVRNPEA